MEWVGVFVTAIVSAAGGAAFAWARSMAAQLKKANERDKEHSQMVDRALVVLLRQQLIDEHDKLINDGYAGFTKRSAWQQAYEIYESLCEASGTRNGVMDDYMSDIQELPTTAD